MSGDETAVTEKPIEGSENYNEKVPPESISSIVEKIDDSANESTTQVRNLIGNLQEMNIEFEAQVSTLCRSDECQKMQESENSCMEVEDNPEVLELKDDNIVVEEAKNVSMFFQMENFM